MKTAVYSGTFDPLHIGHLAIMETLTRETDFDWVYLVVSPQNPWKGERNRMTAQRRYEAAVDAVARHPGLRVRVDDIELQMEPPQYTIRTLHALSRREPDTRFTLVIGGDNLAGIRRWRSYKSILTRYGVAVYPRRGYDIAALRADLLAENRRYRIRLLDAPIVDISSTEIREGEKAGRDMSAFKM